MNERVPVCLESIDEAAASWYAVYVQSRCEFVARRQFTRLGIENYLPTMKKTTQWHDRKKTLDWPLFPGYLFVRVAPIPREFAHVLKTHGVVCLLGTKPGSPTPVTAEEILHLQMMTRSGEHLSVMNRLQVGARVRIRQGVLEGVSGVLGSMEAGNKCLFGLNIEILGRSVCVMVSPGDVEPIAD
ncbi:MAG: UpxY family transcription antiterminator [Desulfobacteraceae bacterium]|nr:UpxY family transcription antiterminator [Desulfobacteraceae bacterium]